MTTGEKIKERRLELHMSADDLAAKLGKSRATIYRYENGGIKDFPFTVLAPLAKALHMSPSDLVEYDDAFSRSDLNNASSPHPVSEHYVIPLLATVAAGRPIYSEEYIEDWIGYDSDPKGRVFAVRVKGDSMLPRIVDGDIVVADQERCCEDGDICIVTVNGNDGTVKKVYKNDNGLTLVSLNPSYAPMFFSAEQVQSLPVRVIGRVVQVRSYL